ncbi:MAG: hypothetical protein ACOZDY_02945 [Pseudomonadota bacterium]
MLQRLGKVVALFVVALAGVASVSPVSAQEHVNVPLLLCPWGCGPTEGDTILMNQMI